MLKEFYFIFILGFFLMLPFSIYSQTTSFYQINLDSTYYTQELNDLIMELIENYTNYPTEKNKIALENQISINYDKAVIEKKEKLEEIKRTSNDPIQIDKLQDSIDDMIENRDENIHQILKQCIDVGLKLKQATRSKNYLEIPGIPSNITIAYTTVTNKEYREFIKATSYPTPFHWKLGIYPEHLAEYPVTYVSYYDALAYCKWLTKQDDSAIYRLPTEQEWERAAGFIPRDAVFNAETYEGLASAYSYSETKSASGSINMWGNVWEWTSTRRDDRKNAVKGGAWNSTKDQCKTDYRQESKFSTFKYDNVGFRVIRVKLINK